jgi:hypothetical protein
VGSAKRKKEKGKTKKAKGKWQKGGAGTLTADC